jgi:hypothetical protein
MDALDLFTENYADSDQHCSEESCCWCDLLLQRTAPGEEAVSLPINTWCLLQDGGCTTTWPIFSPVTPIFFPNASKFAKFEVGTLTYCI